MRERVQASRGFLLAGVQLGERVQPASVRYLSAEALSVRWDAAGYGVQPASKGTDAGQQGLSVGWGAACQLGNGCRPAGAFSVH